MQHNPQHLHALSSQPCLSREFNMTLSQSEREAVAGTVALARHARGPQATGPGAGRPALLAGRRYRCGLAWLLLCGAYRDLRKAPWVEQPSPARR